MSKINRYEYEGKVIEIPLRWDEHSKKEIEDYSLFIEQSPIYTPEGRPILLTIEDACPHAVMVDDDPASIDCGSCIYFRQPAESILGVCHNEKMRSGSAKQMNMSASTRRKHYEKTIFKPTLAYWPSAWGCCPPRRWRLRRSDRCFM